MSDQRHEDENPFGNKHKREGTFSRLISSAVHRITYQERYQKVQRGHAVAVSAIRRRFTPAGKLVVTLMALTILAMGGWIAYTTIYAGSAEGLRQQVTRQLAANDYVAAKGSLEQLRRITGSLSPEDRRRFWLPISEGLHQQEVRAERAILAHRGAGRWDAALDALEELERIGHPADRVLFLRAEILRKADRLEEAVPYYAEHYRRFPRSTVADNDLFWQAAWYKEQGDKDRTRALLEELLKKFGDSTDFYTSTLRWLEQLQ